MKIGLKVTITHPTGEFPPTSGTLIERTHDDDKGLILKVEHNDDGDIWETWYPDGWVRPMLRLV